MGTRMYEGGRLPDSAYLSRPWRIREVVPDFELEDVWELPGHGQDGDFPRLVELFCQMDPGRGASSASRVLFAIRFKLGALLGWDDEGDGIGERVASLRQRLPADLRDAPPP